MLVSLAAESGPVAHLLSFGFCSEMGVWACSGERDESPMPALLTANLQLAPSLSAQLATFHRWKKDLKGESARPRSCSKRAAELGMGPRPPYFSEDQPEGGTSWARWGQGHGPQ